MPSTLFNYDTVPAHTALRQFSDARSGHRRVAGGLQWKRPRGRRKNTWVRQVEFDIEMTQTMHGTLQQNVRDE